jgi:hypothetical protein
MHARHPHFYVCRAFVCRIYFCEPSIFDLYTVVRCVATEDPAAGVSLWCACVVEVLFFWIGCHVVGISRTTQVPLLQSLNLKISKMAYIRVQCLFLIITTNQGKTAIPSSKGS